MYLLTGDGPEERKCAEVRGWPFIQVSLSASNHDKAAAKRLTDIKSEIVLGRAHQ